MSSDEETNDDGKTIAIIERFIDEEERYASELETIFSTLEAGLSPQQEEFPPLKKKKGKKKYVLGQLISWHNTIHKFRTLFKEIVANQRRFADELRQTDDRLTDVLDRVLSIIFVWENRMNDFRLYALYGVLVQPACELLTYMRSVDEESHQQFRNAERANDWDLPVQNLETKLLKRLFQRVTEYTAAVNMIRTLATEEEAIVRVGILQKFFQTLDRNLQTTKADIEELARVEQTEKNLYGMKLLDQGSHLTEYGHQLLQRAMDVKAPGENSYKSRFVILLDLAVVIFDKRTRDDKPLKSDKGFQTYVHLVDLPLEKYSELESYTNEDKRFKLSTDEEEPEVYQFKCDEVVKKMQWIANLFRSLSKFGNAYIPTDIEGHSFKRTTFDDAPLLCGQCNEMFGGMIMQGYSCTQCHMRVHEECLQLIDEDKACNPEAIGANLANYPWYVGVKTKEDVEHLLNTHGGPTTQFVVRLEASGHVLSVRSGREIEHIHIQESETKGAVLRYANFEDDNVFMNLPALIRYYRHHPFKVRLRGGGDRLEEPCTDFVRQMRCCMKNVPYEGEVDDVQEEDDAELSDAMYSDDSDD